MKELDLYTSTLDQTHLLGEKIGRYSFKNSVYLLDGDLGAGKTTLTQGIAKGLNIKKNITSPTFNILKIYKGNLPLYHIDAYRLEGVHQDLGFDELLDDDGVTVIEWSCFVKELIPEEYMMISITLEENGDRKFQFTAHGNKYENILEDLAC